MNNIFIFKTNIQTHEDQGRVSVVLDSHDLINSWSVDKEDIDCVLRVVSTRGTPEEIIEAINQIGYNCEELE